MSNLLKYVENLYNEAKSVASGNRSTPEQIPKSPNNAQNLQSNKTNTSNVINNYNTSNYNNNNSVIQNKGYLNTNLNLNVNNSNNTQSSSALDLFRKRKEIKENQNEESQITIFGSNPNFNLDLKVFGRSIFQNLILTATASSKSNYTTNGSLSENNPMIIPVKCIWKRFKNETEISISNINTNSYIPTAEDIGYTILVEAVPVDRSLYGDLPLYAQYGPIEMDLNVKNTLELLLTAGGTKFSCYLYDSVEQEKKADKELILYVNSTELRLCEVDYTGKEKDLERCKLHHFNPQILLNAKDTQRFLLRFFQFEDGKKTNFLRKTTEKNLNNNNITSNLKMQSSGFAADDEKNFQFEAKFTQEVRKEYDLIAMSKQCRELIYLLIQIFLIDEKIKNSKLFGCANYSLLPQDTKIGVTDLITEIKTLREENVVLINNVIYFENLNANLRKEMKELEEEFQSSLESINHSIRINTASDINYNNSNSMRSSNSNSNNIINKNSATNFNNVYTSNKGNYDNNISSKSIDSDSNFCSKCCSNNANNNNKTIAINFSNNTNNNYNHISFPSPNNNNTNNNNNNNYNNIPKTNTNTSGNNNNKINVRSSSSTMGHSEVLGNYLDLKIKYDELKESNLNLVSKEKALREENQDLLLKLEISKNSLSELSVENKKLKENLNQASSDMVSVNKNSQVLLEQKNKFQLRSEAFEKENEMLMQKNSELSLKIEEMNKTQNLDAKNKFEINEKKIEELNKKNENLNYEIKNLIIQRNLLSSQKDNITKEFEKLKNEKAKFDKVQKDSQQEIDNLNEIIKEKEKVLITLNNEVELSKKTSKEIKEKYQLLEIEHISLKENFDKNFLNLNNNYNRNNNNNLLLESFDYNNHNNDNDDSSIHHYGN